MTTCHNCGASGATQRRWVTTSTGSWASVGRSSRSLRIGAGSRQSVRTLCRSCAGVHDRIANFILWAIIICVTLVAGGPWLVKEYRDLGSDYCDDSGCHYMTNHVFSEIPK